MQPQQNLDNPSSVAGRPQTGATHRKRKRRLGGMVWILIGIAALFAIGGILTATRKNVAPRPVPSAPLSYIGINTFENAPGGVMIRDVWPPDSPADKAGLVGGDIITVFDGHATIEEDEMMRLLGTTPPGKEVEINYIRDSEVKQVKLTTISRSEKQHLDAIFQEREEGRGQFGYDDGDAEVVSVPGKNIKGVQLNGLSPSGPARIAGVEEGDIVIEFDGVPIRTTSELVLRVRRAIPYSTVKIIVIRGTKQLEISVRMGMRGE